MSDNGNGNGHGKRAVLYARCSGDDRGKDGRNLASQLELARQYALGKGYQIVEEVSEDDKGASGAAFELEGLTRIRAMAAAGAFDVLIPREIDRLSRNLAKQLIVEEELRRAGVGIEYALAEYPDTPEGRLSKHIRATIAEYEREKIVERIVRGRSNKVKAGNVLTYGRVPFGYQMGEVDGKATLIICEPEAQVVRLIFSWYANGNSDGQPMAITDIARELTRLGVPTRGDTSRLHCGKKRGLYEWARGTVHRMLKNETYAGCWYYGKTTETPGGRKFADGSTWLAVDVPAIVDRSTWAIVQARLTENRMNNQGGRKKQNYLLSGRVTCGSCGLKMSGTSTPKDGAAYRYYRCPAQRRRLDYSHDCGNPLFLADQVDTVVWNWLKGFLTNPEELARGLREHQAQGYKEHEPTFRRLAVINDLLTENQKQLDRLLDLYLMGDFPKDALTDRKARLEMTIRGLERERAGLMARLEAATLTDEQIRDIMSFAAELAPGLEEAEEDLTARRVLVQRLRVQAVLSTEAGGCQVVDVSCVVDDDGHFVLRQLASFRQRGQW